MSLLLGSLRHWFLILGPQMFLHQNSQKPSLLGMPARVSGSCSPKTSGEPRLGTTGLRYGASFGWVQFPDRPMSLDKQGKPLYSGTSALHLVHPKDACNHGVIRSLKVLYPNPLKMWKTNSWSIPWRSFCFLKNRSLRKGDSITFEAV